MLMVVFGAGASYDSVPSNRPDPSSPRSPQYKIPYLSNRPPLADELFDNRKLFNGAVKKFPKCQPIIPLLQGPDVKVEHVLETLQMEANQSYEDGHRQLAAVRYYLHYMLWECLRDWNLEAPGRATNYKTFLDQVERRRKTNEVNCLVAFNYDTMLEDALHAFNVKIPDIQHYISSDKYKHE